MTDNTAPERGDTPIQEAALVAMEYLTRLGVRPTAVPDEREAAALRVVAEYAYEHPRLLRWLDEQAAAEERFARRAQAMGSKNGHAGAVLRAQVYRHVKGHIEGRDTHE